MVAASSAGASHRNGRNEDAWLAASRLDGTLLLAAADGAGSARCAAAASQLAVRRTCELLSEGPLAYGEAWRDHLLTLLLEVRSTLLRAVVHEIESGSGPVPPQPHDYATTLLLTVLTASELVALQLGDGAIVARQQDGDLARPLQPLRGQHAGETVFVTSSEAIEAARIAVVPASGLTGVALLTDGLEALATDLRSGAPFAPFFDPLFEFAAGDDSAKRSRDLGAFLETPRVSGRSHDDKTLILARRP